MYRMIEPAELLDQAWSKERLKHRAPNVCAMTEWFNIISNWVTSKILECSTIRARREVMTRFIKIAKALLDMNNFSTMWIITSALDSTPIHRLKHTWAEIDKNSLADYQECMTTMSTERAYRVYREKIKFTQPPCVPYLGVYQTDLTFTEDGNPKFKITTDGKKVINWKRNQLIYEVIASIKHYQVCSYDFQAVYQIQKLLEKTFGEHVLQSDEELYQKSCQLEPRNSTRQSIA
jgi:son of sevenless-like protein